MIFNKNYALITHEEKIAVVLSFMDILDDFPQPSTIDSALFDGENITVSNAENSLQIPIVNDEDRVLLSNNEKFLSVLDDKGELLTILRIN